MGPLRAVFKADGDETRGRYSISEWWLEPYTRGPGAHKHEEDDVFFVIEGTMSFFVGGAWIDARARHRGIPALARTLRYPRATKAACAIHALVVRS